jgi:hypothetical protein
MAPKSKKVETGKAASKAARVVAGASGSSSDAAPPSVPAVAGDGKTPSTLVKTHTDATGANGAPAVPSNPSSHPSTSDATQAAAPAASDAKHLDVANLALSFDDADSALSDGLIGRESLEIGNDDFEQEKSGGRPKYWVKKFTEAFGKDYLIDPEDTKKNRPEQKAWYARWQKQAHKVLVAIFEVKDQSHLEKCCWFLFDSIMKTHELGAITTAAKNWAPSKLKCSIRLAYTATIIEKFAPVRLDVLRVWHIEEIAASPEDFIKRKLINCWNNGIRAEKIAKSKKAGKAAVQQEADDDEEAQAAADGEEGAEAQESADLEEDQETRDTSSHVKSKQALPPAENKTAADGTEKSGDKGKEKANTRKAEKVATKKPNTKRARSASPEPRDTQANKKPAATRKRPAVKKTPVAVGTKGRSGGKAAGAGAGAEAGPTT